MSSVIGGAKGGGGQQAARTPVIAPDSTRSRGVIEIVEAWGWGEIEGFPGADPLEYIKLDGTPIRSGGVDNFKGVTFDYRLGTQNQSYIPGTLEDAIGTPVEVGLNVTHAIPQTQTINDVTTDAVRIIIGFSALVRTNPDNGDRIGAAVELKIEVKPLGGAWHTIELYGRQWTVDKIEGPYQREYTVNLKAVDAFVTSYDVRVSRVSADPDTNETSAFAWVSYVKLAYAKLRRPNIPHCRLTFDTRYFSSVPVRSYDLKGLKIGVPDEGYDPAARTYTPGVDWTSGTLIQRYCNNPAWFFYHLLVTAGSGLGAEINTAYQDKWSIYTIAKRCDELVPDGAGGLEHRYSIDAQFMTQTSAHDMLQQIAGVFDAMCLWDGQSVYLTQDAPKAVSALFMPANVVNGRFSYTGTARQVRYTAAIIQYNDITDQSRLTQEYVEDFDAIDRYGYRPKAETMVGCISRGEAHRRGKRLLVSAREEIDAVAFSVGLNGISNKPGDIIRLADPLRTSGARMGGRIAAGSTTSLIQLDAPVILPSGSNRLAIIGNDGAVKDTAIISSGTVSALAVSPAFSAAPERELEFIVYQPAAIAQTFRILSIAENDDKSSGFYTVSATQYSAGKFSEIDDTADFEPQPENPYIINGVIPPSGLTTNEGTITSLEGIKRYLQISWTASNDRLLRGYLLTVRKDGVELFSREISGQSYRVNNATEGTYEITIAAVNIVGRYSASLTVEHVMGILYLITAVSIINMQPSGDHVFTGRDVTFTWETDAAEVLGSFATDIGGQSPWFRDYQIDIYENVTLPAGAWTLLRTEYITENRYVYNYEKNLADGGPFRTVIVRVRARDYYGYYSQPGYTHGYNPPPVDFSSVSYIPGLMMIFVTYDQPSDLDYESTNIYASQTSGFTPGPSTLVGQINTRVASFPVTETGDWYVRLEGVDAFGPAGSYSTETLVHIAAGANITAAVDEVLADPGRAGDFVVEAARFLVVQDGTTTPKKAVFGVGTLDGVTTVGIRGDLVLDGSFYGRSIAAASIVGEKIYGSTLSAIKADLGTITAGTLKTSNLTTGWRLEISDLGTYPLWYGTGVTKYDITHPNTIFTIDKVGNAYFKGNLYAATGTFSGTVQAGHIVGGDISIGSTGAFTVDSEGNVGIYRGSINMSGGGVFSIKSSPTGARTEMTSNVIKIFDGAGVTRVKLGNLNA